jgi:hypothetical protein
METLILLAAFILVPLANYLLERMRRRYEPAPPESGHIPGIGMRRQAAPPPEPLSFTSRERATKAPSMSAVDESQIPQPVHTLFRNKHEVRRVIVAITVLGPCRAYDPPD